jgi:hypothetical protein
MGSHLHRTGAHADALRGLRHGETFDVEQLDRLALALGERRERALELVERSLQA